MTIQRSAGLVWATRILVVLALPCPLLEILHRLAPGPIGLPQPGAVPGLGHLLRVLLACCALYWFVFSVSAKFVCAVLAVLTIAVALTREMEQRTRALTVAAGALTCCLLLWWVNTVTPS